jgi:hypothetical protein
MFSTLLSVLPFPNPVLEFHINDIRSITIHISYSENHDSILLVFYYCYMSPVATSSISLIRVILFQSVLLSMLLNYKKLSWHLINWQLSVLNVNGHAYSYPLPPLWRWGLNLDLNSIERVIIHLSVPKNYGFDTIINYYFYRSLYWPRSV